MSNIEALLLILFAINSAALIFLLFERDRMLKLIKYHSKWLCNLDDKARCTVDHVNILGAKVFDKQR